MGISQIIMIIWLITYVFVSFCESGYKRYLSELTFHSWTLGRMVHVLILVILLFCGGYFSI